MQLHVEVIKPEIHLFESNMLFLCAKTLCVFYVVFMLIIHQANFSALHAALFEIKERGRITVLMSHMIDETITPQIQTKIKIRLSPYLTSFDAVEQFWVWIPFQSHCTDYTLKDKTKVG